MSRSKRLDATPEEQREHFDEAARRAAVPRPGFIPERAQSSGDGANSDDGQGADEADRSDRSGSADGADGSDDSEDPVGPNTDAGSDD